ncbi:hypothetical protein QBC36DRAFT_333959 [Triangularia setosa]|uniref:Secreted protein n=1 Tax=Triangularia setosa TaxID=2587417 RepID=A0AAN7A5R0_9PEZI|nr:hypothetical protein QBC36DRAFT_333959 [Podospora setosa]
MFKLVWAVACAWFCECTVCFGLWTGGRLTAPMFGCALSLAKAFSNWGKTHPLATTPCAPLASSDLPVLSLNIDSRHLLLACLVSSSVSSFPLLFNAALCPTPGPHSELSPRH